MEKGRINKIIISEVSLFDLFLFIKKFINFFMLKGKKLKFEIILNKVFIKLKLLGYNPLEIFSNFIFKLKPLVGLKLTKFRRRKILFPILLKKEKSYFFLIKWFYESILKRSEKNLVDRIVNEFLDIINNRGLTVKKFNDFNLIVVENKPYLWRKYKKYKNKTNKKNKIRRKI